MPRSSDGREERRPLPPPDVRHRALEHDAVRVDEDRLVGAAPLRLGLGGHVHRVARRLHARQEPRRRRLARRAARRRARRALRAVLDPGRDLAQEREAGRRTALGPRRPDEPEHRVAVARRSGEHERGELLELGARTAGSPMLRRRGLEPVEVRVEPERATRVDAQRLERGAAAEQRLVVGADDGLVRVDEPAAGHGERERLTATLAGRRAAARRSRRAAGAPSSTTRRPRPRDRSPRRRRRRPRGGCGPSATANVRIVSASSRSPFPWTRPSAPIDAPRPTGSSSAMRSTAAIFGAPVTEPPGNVASRSSAEPDVLAKRALDRRDHVLDPGELARGHELRPAHRSRLADAREVVPLEVDDHHVLGRVLLRLAQLVRRPERARALDRHRPDPPPAPREEQLGRRRHDRPAVADERLRVQRAQRRELGGERARLARERRRQVLHEVDLVDVAARDRLAHALDRGLVVRGAPGRLPRADDEALVALSHATESPSVRTRQAASGSGQGSGGGGDGVAANRPPRGRSRGRGPRRGARRPGAKNPCSRSHSSSRPNAPSGSWSSSIASCQPPCPTDAGSATSAASSR